MKTQGLTQSQLANKLKISRVCICQILALLKLPKAQLDYIMQNGEKKKITERKLRMASVRDISDKLSS
ncbi:MAG: hypothetical protein K8S27_05640 [Candidatus Omnitrophica bacterium]|nr:hypothetical protein [Candidatus Omnitrophota bacterium]